MQRECREGTVDDNRIMIMLPSNTSMGLISD